MKNKLLLIIAIAVCAVSCGPLGKYKPVTEVDNSIYGRGVELSDSASNFALLKWRDVYKDTCLQNLIQQALDNNKDLQIAYERVVQSNATLTGAKLSYAPSLALTPTIGGNFEKGQSPVYPYYLSASASWEIDIFGKIATKVRTAKATAAQAEDYRQGVHTKLVSTVANTYYALLMLDEELVTAREMEKVWEKTVSTIRQLKEWGFADEVAVNQYEATYASMRLTAIDLRRQIDITENAMALLLAVPGQKIQRTKLAEQTVPEEINVGIPVQMLTLRPDVRAAQRGVEAAFYTTKSAWLNFFPSLTLTGDAGLSSITGVLPMNVLANIGAGLTAPIFTAGANRTNLKIAESKQREARLTFETTMLQAGTEVNDALVDFRATTEMIKHYIHQVYNLEQARDNTQLIMDNSQDKTYLDVLAAHNSLVQAKFALIQNRTQRLQSVVSLYEALGGGIN